MTSWLCTPQIPSPPAISANKCHPYFVQDAEPETYDIIVVDSSDPVGPAEVLYQKVRPAVLCLLCADCSVLPAALSLLQSLLRSACCKETGL